MLKTKAILGATVFLSAFLLFSVEPLIAKKILPWFGGSAAVWSVCLVFFQGVLLLGYIYARLLAQLRPAQQALLHAVLLGASCAALPLGPRANWRPALNADPTWPLIALLCVSVGLPFFALSATSPLLQAWASRSGSKNPYRLFALSNVASLAALISYPFLVEPLLDLNIQSVCWSWGYGLFVLLNEVVAWNSRRAPAGITETRIAVPVAPQWTRILVWFALSGCGSMLLLSVTNHLSENVAAVPLLWVLPLATYLLTFVLSFDSARFYHRGLFLRLLAMALGVMAFALYDIRFVEVLQVALPVFLLALFICCMFCHGELHRLRPERERLTSFYVAISAGGAAGAIFVGIGAPHIFTGIYELPVTLILTAGLALLLTWKPAEGAGANATWMLRLLWMAVTGVMIFIFQANVAQYSKGTLYMQRSFYGALRVVQSLPGARQTRTLFHGAVTHGAQYLLPPLRFRPTTYYGPESGIGILLRECYPAPKRVGIIGLGVGTIAAYGQRGDTFRFYEINPQVVTAAQSLFTYLRETPAEVEIAVGDGRLSIAQDRSAPLDVLAIDAFSGDAIPIHLLTIEAVRLYQSHLKPGGAMAFHVSNDYLDLAPVVRDLAHALGYRAIMVHNHADDDNLVLPADWVVVTNNAAVLNNPTIQLHSESIDDGTGLRLWTDSFSNLAQILKTPHWR